MVKLGAIREKLGSPQLAKMWAILATIAAAISYAAFLTSGGGFGSITADLAISTLVFATLIGIHTQLILDSPGIRTHPHTRAVNPDPFLGVAMFLVNQCLPFLLTKNHLTIFSSGDDGGDVFSVIAAAAYFVDLVFVLLCLLPEWGGKYHLLESPVVNLMIAMSPMFRASEAFLWFFCGFMGIYLVFSVHQSITLLIYLRRWE